MYKKLIQTAVFACALALTPMAFAACGEGLKNVIDSLHLDENQKAKVKPILEQLKSAILNDVNQMKDIRQQLNQQAESANMDQSAVDSLVDKKTKLIGDMIKLKIAAKNQIYAILNPQQKTDLQNKMKQMEEKWAEKFNECHGE